MEFSKTVARMCLTVLCMNNHHTASRRQTTARAGERGARDVLYGCVPEDALSQAAGARYFAMDAGEDVGEAPAAGRPAPLLEVLPQERVQRRTAEQIVDPVPVVPLLFMVEPQMVEQLVDILSPLDFRVAEQVIEVPNIVCPPRAARTVLRAPQTAELLVEVPTIISYSSLLQRTLEQNVDIPVPHRAGRIADLQGFLPGQSSTALQERISERLLEQMIVCIPGGGPQGFRPGQSSSSSSHRPAGISEDTDEPGDGFFRNFLWGKKSAEIVGQVSADLPRHVSSWNLAAYVQPTGVHEEQLAKEKEEAEGDVSAACSAVPAAGADVLPPRHLGTVFRVHVARGVIKGDDGRMYPSGLLA